MVEGKGGGRRKKKEKSKENLSYPVKAQGWEDALGDMLVPRARGLAALKVTGNMC